MFGWDLLTTRLVSKGWRTATSPVIQAAQVLTHPHKSINLPYRTTSLYASPPLATPLHPHPAQQQHQQQQQRHQQRHQQQRRQRQQQQQLRQPLGIMLLATLSLTQQGDMTSQRHPSSRCHSRARRETAIAGEPRQQAAGEREDMPQWFTASCSTIRRHIEADRRGAGVMALQSRHKLTDSAAALAALHGSRVRLTDLHLSCTATLVPLVQQDLSAQQWEYTAGQMVRNSLLFACALQLAAPGLAAKGLKSLELDSECNIIPAVSSALAALTSLSELRYTQGGRSMDHSFLNHNSADLGAIAQAFDTLASALHGHVPCAPPSPTFAHAFDSAIDAADGDRVTMVAAGFGAAAAAAAERARSAAAAAATPSLAGNGASHPPAPTTLLTRGAPGSSTAFATSSSAPHGPAATPSAGCADGSSAGPHRGTTSPRPTDTSLLPSPTPPPAPPPPPPSLPLSPPGAVQRLVPLDTMPLHPEVLQSLSRLSRLDLHHVGGGVLELDLGWLACMQGLEALRLHYVAAAEGTAGQLSALAKLGSLEMTVCGSGSYADNFELWTAVTRLTVLHSLNINAWQESLVDESAGEDPYNIKALEFPPALRFPSLTRLGLMLTEEDPDFLAGVAGMTHLTELALVVGGAEECWESDSAGSQDEVIPPLPYAVAAYTAYLAQDPVMQLDLQREGERGEGEGDGDGEGTPLLARLVQSRAQQAPQQQQGRLLLAQQQRELLQPLLLLQRQRFHQQLQTWGVCRVLDRDGRTRSAPDIFAQILMSQNTQDLEATERYLAGLYPLTADNTRVVSPADLASTSSARHDPPSSMTPGLWEAMPGLFPSHHPRVELVSHQLTPELHASGTTSPLSDRGDGSGGTSSGAPGNGAAGVGHGTSVHVAVAHPDCSSSSCSSSSSVSVTAPRNGGTNSGCASGIGGSSGAAAGAPTRNPGNDGTGGTGTGGGGGGGGSGSGGGGIVGQASGSGGGGDPDGCRTGGGVSCSEALEPSEFKALFALRRLRHLSMSCGDETRTVPFTQSLVQQMPEAWPELRELYLMCRLPIADISVLRPFRHLVKLELLNTDAVPYSLRLDCIPLSVRALSTQNVRLLDAHLAAHLAAHLTAATFYMTSHMDRARNGGLSLCGWLRSCAALEKLSLEYRTTEFHRALCLNPKHSPLHELRGMTCLKTLGLFFADGCENHPGVLDSRLVEDVSALTSVEDLEMWNCFASDWKSSTSWEPLSHLKRLRSLRFEAAKLPHALAIRDVLQRHAPFCRVRITVDHTS
ncbi:MAG: hypothetical protein WDW36_006525 [Sanguina aurantia]